MGHNWRSKDELISDIVLWTPSNGRAKARRPARIYIQPLYAETGYSLEDLPGAMDDREGWRERGRRSLLGARHDIYIYIICKGIVYCWLFSRSFDGTPLNGFMYSYLTLINLFNIHQSRSCYKIALSLPNTNNSIQYSSFACTLLNEFLSNINNSTYHLSFGWMQLKVFRNCDLTLIIQFSINHLFEYI